MNMENKMIETIESLVSERSDAMKEENAARANEIENELARFGVRLSDTRHGTFWKVGPVHREHIAFLQKTAAQQIQQAHLRSGWPSAGELYAAKAEIMRKELVEICSALDDPRTDLTATMPELVRELKADARRYEHVRRLNVPEFKKLFVENLTSGIPFDTLVDNAIAESKL